MARRRTRLTMDLLSRTFARTVLAAGRRHTVGLKPDGTVIAAGDNTCGQCGVDGWREIVSVAAASVHVARNTGNAHTVGLRADGTVVAAG